jgi:tryptophan-rich sensory protein|tara:strand:- start:896 stop:1288 length:393 start_codon:yes stop_codon:yes gene_type:complete
MNYLYLLLPMFSVYLVGVFYPIGKEAGKDIPFRPPSWVFGVVWPILLILIGYSWTLRPGLTNYYLLLTLLLSTWSIFYANNRMFAFLNILATIGLTVYLILHKFKKKSSYLLIPLVAWLSFASYLAYNSI